MNDDKQKFLEDAGYVFMDADEFLGLTEEEKAELDRKMSKLRSTRKRFNDSLFVTQLLGLAILGTLWIDSRLFTYSNPESAFAINVGYAVGWTMFVVPGLVYLFTREKS